MDSKRWSSILAAMMFPLFALADDLAPACMSPETGPDTKVTLLCMAEMPNSRSRCQKYLEELASLENRSLEQTLALAFGRAFASQFEDDVGADEKAELAGRELLRPLVDASPNDAMLLYAYSSFHHDHEERYRALLRRVLALDPACTRAAFWLSDSLGRSEGDAAREESMRYLQLGYDHAEGARRLVFARLKYSALKDDRPDEAATFRDRVAADVASWDLPLDRENRARSLDVLCNSNGLLLRLDASCANAIRMLAGRDRSANARLGDDVLAAVDSLSASAEDGELGDDGAKHHQELLQLLEAEPERLRTAWFYVVYSHVLRPVVGHDAEADALHRALALDPRSGEIGLYLSGAMENAGRPAHTIAEIYRHVIANADGRAVERGMPADYYVEAATKYLRELEADGGQIP